jgi:DNA primase
VTTPIWDIVSPYLSGARRSGQGNMLSICPFHDDTSRSFSFHVETGQFHCFGCGVAGSLSFFLRLVGKSRNDVERIVAPVRDAMSQFIRKRIEKEKWSRIGRDPFIGEHVLPESLLGAYDRCPVYMTKRGFHKSLIRAKDVGFDVVNERVTFPIRDLYGNLVGIAGRSTNGEEPRYKVYKKGFQTQHGYVTDFGKSFDQDFPSYDIRKGEFLWNGNEAIPLAFNSDDPVVLVEGYKACLWVLQCGFPQCTALMGAVMTKTQRIILDLVDNPIVLFLDNNQAGVEGMFKIGRLLRRTHNVTVAAYPNAEESSQPDDHSRSDIESAIHNAVRWDLWERKAQSSHSWLQKTSRLTSTKRRLRDVAEEDRIATGGTRPPWAKAGPTGSPYSRGSTRSPFRSEKPWRR